MVGDWVLVNGNPMQIQAINDIDGEIIAGDELYCLIEDRVHSEDKIEPIPLTAEILEKNGFVNSGGLWHLSGEDMGLMQGCISFQAFAYYADPRYCFCEIAYLHELQHALRTCGIDKEIVL